MTAKQIKVRNLVCLISSKILRIVREGQLIKEQIKEKINEKGIVKLNVNKIGAS